MACTSFSPRRSQPGTDSTISICQESRRRRITRRSIRCCSRASGGSRRPFPRTFRFSSSPTPYCSAGRRSASRCSPSASRGGRAVAAIAIALVATLSTPLVMLSGLVLSEPLFVRCVVAAARCRASGRCRREEQRPRSSSGSGSASARSRSSARTVPRSAVAVVILLRLRRRWRARALCGGRVRRRARARGRSGSRCIRHRLPAVLSGAYGRTLRWMTEGSAATRSVCGGDACESTCARSPRCFADHFALSDGAAGAPHRERPRRRSAIGAGCGATAAPCTGVLCSRRASTCSCCSLCRSRPGDTSMPFGRSWCCASARHRGGAEAFDGIGGRRREPSACSAAAALLSVRGWRTCARKFARTERAPGEAPAASSDRADRADRALGALRHASDRSRRGRTASSSCISSPAAARCRSRRPPSAEYVYPRTPEDNARSLRRLARRVSGRLRAHDLAGAATGRRSASPRRSHAAGDSGATRHANHRSYRSGRSAPAKRTEWNADGRAASTRAVGWQCSRRRRMVLAVALAMVDTLPVGVFFDDGMYVILAKSLATGRGLRWLQLPGAPAATHFPPGYPFVLSLLWRLYPHFPANVVLFKVANACFLATAAGGIALFAQRRLRFSPWLAAAFAVAATAGLPTLALSGRVMSEPLFLALLIPTLLFAERVVDEERRAPVASLIALGVFVGLVTLVRTNGIAIAGGVLIVLAARRRVRDACDLRGGGGIRAHSVATLGTRERKRRPDRNRRQLRTVYDLARERLSRVGPRAARAHGRCRRAARRARCSRHVGTVNAARGADDGARHGRSCSARSAPAACGATLR